MRQELRVRRARHARALKARPEQVARRCADAFAEETHPRVPDGRIPVTKAALLIALEDEAAAAAAALAPLAARPAAAAAHLDRSSGGAATWSLSRLDALADDALRHFAARHGPSAHPAAAPAGGPDSPDGLDRTPRAPAPPSTQRVQPVRAWLPGPGGAGALRDLGARLQSGLAALLRPAAPTRVNASGAAAASEALGAAAAGNAAAGGARGRRDGPRPAAAVGGDGGSGADALALVRRYPLAALGSVNAVLFQQQGYTACNRWGDPSPDPCNPVITLLLRAPPRRPGSDAQLSSVLERGAGGCVALCILYSAVCARLGLELAVRVLVDEGGSHYCLAWPADAPLAAAGVGRCVVDVYGRGALLTVDEVCELFGVTQEDLLTPSSRRQLLAALLADLLAAHWAAACGTGASPAARLPLLPATALDARVQRLDGAALERAAAAASKRVALLPHCQEARLQLGLLHYFGGAYQDAWLELGILLERARAGADGADDTERAAPVEGSAPGGAGGGATAGPAGAVLAPEVLRDAELLWEKLQLELLVAA
ncbi:hypothetical protein MNEG_5847 [Monoraphidium neglectum]|uniref:Protein SirB1 N-terminal domain-containing protein n=1 Tax=Monoraphidium neglectum TaxID=145388 RepID=A0A0D2MNM2_9CHLO|nr:hypothetical protein MNEG_5847 [Monoraphidium neglectum]KIZ02112.1 hypothetical protein MNEG_5847 [Monoraphidium neglectum]|eukprot:XP_013901131.1 hypothetical protein MNEG_5847 [Monoraphidium neglectum]